MATALIVDDDLPTQQLLAALMRRNGLGSVIASNGAEAVGRIAQGGLAIVILDLMMPEVDGHQVIEYIQRENRGVPVIVCTAAGPRVTDSLDRRVVRAIVRKPFDINEMTALIASITGVPPRG